MGLSGQAAILVDSSEKLRIIIARADANMATRDDQQVLETALKDNYPPTIADPELVYRMGRLKPQGPAEALAAYYIRAQQTLRQEIQRTSS